jgi:hypothetical protein
MSLVIGSNSQHSSFIPAGLDAGPANSPLAGRENIRQHYPMNCARAARRRVLCAALLLFVLISLGAKGAFASAAQLSALTCNQSTYTGSGTDSCLVTLSQAAPAGGLSVSLSSTSGAVTVPASIKVPANASNAAFTAKVSSTSENRTATLEAKAGGVTESFLLQLNAAISALSISPSSVAFGSVALNTPTTHSVTLTSTGNVPVTINSATLTGTEYSMTGAGLPVTLSPGQAATLLVQFDPTVLYVASGKITVSSNASSSPNASIALTGNGTAPAVSLADLSCSSPSMTGPGALACSVTLNSKNTSGSMTVNLASNNSAVTVPAKVVVPQYASSAGFAATVSSVPTTQPATLSASANGVSQAFTLQLNAAIPALSASTSGLAFGNVQVNAASMGSITLTSTGNVPVTVSAAGLTGTGFSLSGASFPLTLNPNQSATVNVQFEPTAAGSATGQLAVTSNSTTGSPMMIGLSGTGLAQVSVLACGSGSMTGSGTEACTVTLNAAAPAGGQVVNLSSNNAAVSVPAMATVPATAASIGFSATVSPVATTQAATLTATANGISQIFGLQLNADVPTLSVATSSSPSSYGSAVTFIATISNGPTGTLTFYDGVNAIGTGTINGTTATFVTSSLVAGSHIITAAWLGNSSCAAVTSGAVTQVVNQATPSISWAAPAALSYGTALGSTQLNANSTVAGTFNYSPAAGIVLTAGAHTLTVTFTPTDTTDYATATSSVSITVGQATPAIAWAAPTAITYGTALGSTQLNATSTVAGTFSYSPAAGTVLTAGSNTLMATFTPTDSTDYATATATVVLTVNTAAPAITWAAPAAITYGTALSAIQLDAGSTMAGTFGYSPAAGTVLTAGTHTLTVTLTPTDTTDYATATSSVSITVGQATPAIAWAAPAAISYGTALSSTQLNATSTVAGTFSYSPAAGAVLTAGSNTLTATFTPTDSTDYATATATVPLTVSIATPTITWATPAAITYGIALSATQLNATASVAGTFAYSPAVGTVLTAGSQTLSVTFTPTNTTDYKTATASVALTINKATPTITWSTPAAIVNGTALSATQLDATASVPGTFAYSPASGTVPATGSQILTVTFTPTDTTDYNTASDSITLTVNAATSTLSINAITVAFGNVDLNTPAAQTVILTSSGTGSLTVNSVTLAGIGFSLSGPTFPATLATGQTATLGIEFNPTVTGAASGTLTVVSTSSTNPTATVPLTGTGIATSYMVNLSWDAPTDSAVPVAGYNIYRAVSGSPTYTLVNPSVDILTSYTDSSVQSGTVYNYEVESVDAAGVASAPTSPISVTVP